MAFAKGKNPPPNYKEETMATELLDDEIPTELTDQTTDHISHEELRGAVKKEAFFRKKEEKFITLF